MTISPSYFLPPLPEGLEDLTELALDLAWSRSHGTDALWERIDPELRAQTRNPWLLPSASPALRVMIASSRRWYHQGQQRSGTGRNRR